MGQQYCMTKVPNSCIFAIKWWFARCHCVTHQMHLTCSLSNQTLTLQKSEMAGEIWSGLIDWCILLLGIIPVKMSVYVLNKV